MEYSNPVLRPNHNREFPFWKKFESNIGFVALGVMFLLLMIGIVNTTDSEDPSVLGDVVVEHALKYPLAGMSEDVDPAELEYVLIVEDVETGDQSRVGVTLDYILSYPPGSVYEGREGVAFNGKY